MSWLTMKPSPRLQTWPLDKVLVSIADLDLAEGNSVDALVAYEQVFIRAKDLSRHGMEIEVQARIAQVKEFY